MNEKITEKPTQYGRPRLSDEERRSCFIKFSCSEKEFEFIKKASMLAGYKSHSNFLHNWFLQTLNDEAFLINDVPAVNEEVVRQLTGLCKNINQLTHRVNLQKGIDSKLSGQLESNLAIVSAISCAAIKYATGYPDDGLKIIESLESSSISGGSAEVNFNTPSKLYSNLYDPIFQTSIEISQLVSVVDLIEERNLNFSKLFRALRRQEKLMLSALNYAVGDFDLAESFYSDYVNLGDDHGNS